MKLDTLKHLKSMEEKLGGSCRITLATSTFHPESMELHHSEGNYQTEIHHGITLFHNEVYPEDLLDAIITRRIDRMVSDRACMKELGEHN